MSIMERDGYLAGIDFGTGGCKITLIEADGRVAAEASREYRTYFEHPGWAEQEPRDWYDTMCAVFADLRGRHIDLKRVRAIALDGSTHNAVLLDAGMKPLRRTIMWTDQRSVNEARELNEKFGSRLLDVAHQMAAPTWTLPQLMWLARHEPEVPGRVRHLLFVKDYVRYLLTGTAATDYIEAEGSLMFDVAGRRFDPELVACAKLDAAAMPDLIAPTDVTGSITAAAARDTGLPAGTPVVCGTSDSAAEDYGAGAVLPGDAIVKLATAGNFNVMTAEAHPHPRTLTYSHPVPGMFYTVTATNAAALCQRWFRDTLCEVEKLRAASSQCNAFALIDELAGSSAAGAGGVQFHPYLQGERSPYWDANLRASFTGLSIASTRGDMARALLEGVAYSLRDCGRTIREMGLPIRRIFLIGGGAKSALWSEIVCNVLNLPLELPLPGDASFGTALLAGVGIHWYPDLREAVKATRHSAGKLEPVNAQVEIYEQGFRRYLAMHDALAKVYAS